MDCRVKTGSRRLSQIDMICNELVIKLEPELARMSDARSEHSVFPLKRDSHKRTHDVQCRERVRNTSPQFQIKQEPGMAENSDSAANMSKCLTGMYLDYSTTLLDGEGKTYECSECHVSFDHQNTLKKHMETHLEKKHTGRKLRREKAFLCSACPSALTTADGLKIHMRRHTGEKPYLCDECPATFADRSTLRKHQGRKHIDHNIFRCSECPAKFRIAEKLETHMRKHTGEKPFKCSECPIAFTFASHLRAHTRIHTGEKPYKCMECFSAFSYSSTLKAHMRVHTGERPYRCTECPKAFASSSSLKYHMKVHTRDNSCLLPVNPVPHAGYQGHGLNHC